MAVDMPYAHRKDKRTCASPNASGLDDGGPKPDRHRPAGSSGANPAHTIANEQGELFPVWRSPAGS